MIAGTCTCICLWDLLLCIVRCAGATASKRSRFKINKQVSFLFIFIYVFRSLVVVAAGNRVQGNTVRMSVVYPFLFNCLNQSNYTYHLSSITKHQSVRHPLPPRFTVSYPYSCCSWINNTAADFRHLSSVINRYYFSTKLFLFFNIGNESIISAKHTKTFYLVKYLKMF